MTDIAILVYPGCMGTQVFGLSDFLRVAAHVAAARSPGRVQPLSTRLVVARDGPVVLAGGVSLELPRLRGRPGLLVVPGLDIGQPGQWPQILARLAPELALLRRRRAAGIPMAAVCGGSFLLAEAGLLADRRAATAWVFEPEFASRYPAVRLVRGAVLCQDGDITSTGAMSSVFDLGQRLAERHFGAAVARAAARLALMGGRRASQQPYVDAALLPAAARPEGRPGAARAAAAAQPLSTRAQHWLGARLAQRYDLAALAAALHTSTRTLLRRYRQETGDTPLRWLQQARVRRAQHLLETSRASVAQVMAAVGYEDPATFSRLFVRLVGETPARYRRRAAHAR